MDNYSEGQDAMAQGVIAYMQWWCEHPASCSIQRVHVVHAQPMGAVWLLKIGITQHPSPLTSCMRVLCTGSPQLQQSKLG
jgi:hypothetical protein